MNDKKVRTSVQLPENLLEAFKIECIKDHTSIQKLVERSVYLYLSDPEYRKKIQNQIDTNLTQQ